MGKVVFEPLILTDSTDIFTIKIDDGNETEFNGKLLSDMKAVKRGGKGNKK